MAVSLEQTVRELFAPIPEVQAVYACGGNLWVFISGDRYDDGLMERLIAQEEALIDMHPEVALWIRFIPLALCDDPHEVTGDAQTIYLADALQ